MTKYHKIQTLYMREPKGRRKIIVGQYSLPVFKLLHGVRWVMTEKVDGTNIRVILDANGKMFFGGKDMHSAIPTPLVNRLIELFSVDKLCDKFPSSDVCLYGEGFGAGIQKVGHLYSANQDFVLFDVRVGDYWLDRKDVVDVAQSLGIPVVPVVATGTLGLMEQMCREGFNSAWGDFPAEGIVARPEVELVTKSGHRVITKLKLSDFERDA